MNLLKVITKYMFDEENLKILKILVIVFAVMGVLAIFQHKIKDYREWVAESSVNTYQVCLVFNTDMEFYEAKKKCKKNAISSYGPYGFKEFFSLRQNQLNIY